MTIVTFNHENNEYEKQDTKITNKMLEQGTTLEKEYILNNSNMSNNDDVDFTRFVQIDKEQINLQNLYNKKEEECSIL